MVADFRTENLDRAETVFPVPRYGYEDAADVALKSTVLNRLEEPRPREACPVLLVEEKKIRGKKAVALPHLEGPVQSLPGLEKTPLHLFLVGQMFPVPDKTIDGPVVAT